ncbi:twin-arginine translocase subunit TatC [Candidatus Micrarchaeota archaeon]|nr:twin-arginine translocase subunit TatC [Candidatus Micrarchaeota archaeon]
MTEKRMTFFGHVDEFRQRLRTSLIVFVIAFFAAFFASGALLNMLWDWFLGAYPPEEYHIVILADSVMSGFVIQLNLAFIIAAAFSMPVFLYEIFMFIEPALSKKHKITAAKMLLSAGFLFLTGASFMYFIMVPMVLGFFLEVNTALGVSNFFTVESFFEFITLNLFIGGLIFQTPLVIVTANRIGILPKDWLVKSRRIVYVVILIIAAIVTPDSSVISQLVLGGVMVVLFELSLFLAK